jgi:hypothetical protein
MCNAPKDDHIFCDANDAAGLFVLITPAGGKLWRFKYRFADKDKLRSDPDIQAVRDRDEDQP